MWAKAIKYISGIKWRRKLLKYISSAFNDDNGNASLMRWLSILCVVNGLVYPYTIELPTAIDYAFATSLITMGLGAKYMQKKIEAK